MVSDLAGIYATRLQNIVNHSAVKKESFFGRHSSDSSITQLRCPFAASLFNITKLTQIFRFKKISYPHSINTGFLKACFFRFFLGRVSFGFSWGMFLSVSEGRDSFGRLAFIRKIFSFFSKEFQKYFS